MDDQFNGRTDDDLFADDFEPVESREEPSATKETQAPPVVENQPQPVGPAEPAAPVQPTTTPNAPRSLAQSRHANAPQSSSHRHPRQRKHSPKPKATESRPQSQPQRQQSQSPAQQESTAKSNGSENGNATTPTTTNHNNNNNNKKPPVSPAKPGQNTALADRLASGANPRTKLTEAELAAKMEQMRILAAEKTRRFEQAERDSRSHAIAYEKGMEEARRRRAEEAERRRRGEEEKRRMDEERAANRERKLKAMGAKEGGSWDEGKNAEEERDRRAGFRGANGGVRGARSGGGLAGSRFAEKENDAVPRQFGPDDFRGRGRGGRGRGTGRGGRGRPNDDGERGGFNRSAPRTTAQNGNTPKPQKTIQIPPTADDFPALPSAKKPSTMNNTADATSPTSLLNSPPIGKWDDEMAALDGK